MFKDWEWGDTWMAAALVFAVGLAGIAIFGMFQDHRVKFYYMSDHGTQ